MRVHKYAYNKDMTEPVSVMESSEPQGKSGKTRITIRIDTDVLDWFRDEVEAAGGGSYQTLINRALREYILMDNTHDLLSKSFSSSEQFNEQQFEATLRRVIREELSALRSTPPVTFKSNTTVAR